MERIIVVTPDATTLVSRVDEALLARPLRAAQEGAGADRREF